MGFLAPLYALAALALAGPILFHLIRRQPRGELPFSSLMFLTASPPRLTRRSRLDNLWLLALRVLALLLIAAAFMRPFLRQDSFDAAALSGRRVVLLLDTSGSMQRPDVWSAAQRTATEALDELSPQDQVGLYTIDRELTAHVPLDQLHATEPRVSQLAVREALKKLRPTWHNTQLVEGLKSVAEQFAAHAPSAELNVDAPHQIVLVSDLHRGISLQGLQGFVWPENVKLDVRQVLPKSPGNARLSLLQEDPEVGAPKISGQSVAKHVAGSTSVPSTHTLRVRIERDSDAPLDGPLLSLRWANFQGPLPGQSLNVQVPPGQVRVLPLDERPATADRIVMSGDAWDGDNTLYIVEPSQKSQQVLFCGREQTQLTDDLSYFLKQAPLDSAGVQRTLEAVAADALSTRLTAADVRAAVIEPTPAVMQYSPAIEQFMEHGGSLLVCLSQPLKQQNQPGGSAAEVAEFLRKLSLEPRLELAESEVGDFSLLAQIDFAHPIFSPLSDPRFNDFSKLRFWSHRRVDLPAESKIRTLASFDDGTAWLLEAPRGAGRLWVLTAGWQPAASGFGLSSKFVPLMMGMLAPRDALTPPKTHYDVGEQIALASAQQALITTAQDRPLDEAQIRRSSETLEILRPGLYWLQTGDERRQVAVQLAASESRLTPLDVAELQALGMVLRPLGSDSQRRHSQRQLQREELEGKQRLWQWLLVGGLVVLAFETWLASWLSR